MTGPSYHTSIALFAALLVAALPVVPVGSAAGTGLRIGVLEDVDTLHPLMTATVVGAEISMLLYRDLVDRDGDPGSGLASVECSPDRTTWTYDLRDVSWHDGVKVTGCDVVFTLDYLQAHGLCVNGRDPAPVVLEVTEERVVLEFARPPEGVPGAGLPIIPRHAWEEVRGDDEVAVTGSGPFRLLQWIPDDFVLLEATSDTALEYVAFVVFQCPERLKDALILGEVDVAAGLPAEIMDRLPSEGLERFSGAPRGGMDHAIRIDRLQGWVRTPAGVLFNGSCATYRNLEPAEDDPDTSRRPVGEVTPGGWPFASLLVLALLAVVLVLAVRRRRSSG